MALFGSGACLPLTPSVTSATSTAAAVASLPPCPTSIAVPAKMAFDLRGAVGASDVVAVGTVARTDARNDVQRGVDYQETTVDVERLLKAPTPAQSLIIHEPRRWRDDNCLQEAPIYNLPPGERRLFFLDRLGHGPPRAPALDGYSIRHAFPIDGAGRVVMPPDASAAPNPQPLEIVSSDIELLVAGRPRPTPDRRFFSPPGPSPDGGTPGPRWDVPPTLAPTVFPAAATRVPAPVGINAFSTRSDPQVVVLRNVHGAPQDLGDWRIVALESGRRFVVPTGTIVAAGEALVIAAGPAARRVDRTTLVWTNDLVFDAGGDGVLLITPGGQIADARSG